MMEQEFKSIGEIWCKIISFVRTGHRKITWENEKFQIAALRVEIFSNGYCHRLNVCVALPHLLPSVQALELHPPCDGAWRGGLREVLRPWSPHKRPCREIPCPLGPVRRQRKASCLGSTSRPPHMPHLLAPWSWTALAEPGEYIYVVCKPPRLWHFVIAAQTD